MPRLCLALVLASCSACAPQQVTRSGTINQQGGPSSPPVALASPASIESPAPGVERMPWTGLVLLYCATPAGPGCLAVSRALGTGAKTGASIPDDVLELADLPRDCDEPVIAAMRARLVSHAGIEDSWAEQIGTPLPRASLGERYAAAGCISPNTTPTVKISMSARTRRYLVRVWEGP